MPSNASLPFALLLSVSALIACGSSDDPSDPTGSGGSATGNGAGGSGAGTGAGGSGGTSSGSATGGGGSAPQSGTYTAIGVGNWGLRGITTDGSAWTVCQNPSTGNDHSPDLLRNVGYGDGVFIAVGGDANAMVMRSLDGIHWEEDLHPTSACDGEPYPPSCTNWMGGVAYGGGTWLAGGGNGALMRSTDAGQTWTGIHPADGPNAVRSIAYGAGLFVAGSDGGRVSVSSDDGDSWTNHDLWAQAMEIAFGGGTFIAKGQNWNGSGFDYGCFVSTDQGGSWSACSSELLDAGAPLYADGQWVAATDGGYLSSDDGVSWTMNAATDFPRELLFTGELWIGLRNGSAYTSTNLTDWQQTATGIPGFRAFTGGMVLDDNLPVEGVAACQDNG